MDIDEFSLPGAKGDGLLEIGDESIEITKSIANEHQESHDMSKFTEGKPALTKEEQNEINSAFIKAAENNEINTMLRHLEAGANINSQNDSGQTALMFFALSGPKEIVNLLLKSGAEVNVKDRSGDTAVLYSVISSKRENKEIINLLLENGAEVNVPNNSDGKTPLMHAAYARRKDITALFVKHGAEVNAQDNRGETALMMAAWGPKDVAELLLDHGADVHLRNNQGETALMMAANSWGGKDTVELLLDHGAEVNAQDNRGETALMMAAKSRGGKDAAECLLDHGADVHLRNNQGETALMMAAKSQDGKDTVEFLLKHGADVNAQAQFGMTPLMYAIQMGSKDIVEFLVNHGAEVDVRDNNVMTPLMYAAEGWRSKNIVEFLVNHGAEAYVQDNQGRTALGLATEFRRIDTVDFLTAHNQRLDEFADHIKQEFIYNSPVSKEMKQSPERKKLLSDVTKFNKENIITALANKLTSDELIAKRASAELDNDPATLEAAARALYEKHLPQAKETVGQAITVYKKEIEHNRDFNPKNKITLFSADNKFLPKEIIGGTLAYLDERDQQAARVAFSSSKEAKAEAAPAAMKGVAEEVKSEAVAIAADAVTPVVETDKKKKNDEMHQARITKFDQGRSGPGHL